MKGNSSISLFSGWHFQSGPEQLNQEGIPTVVAILEYVQGQSCISFILCALNSQQFHWVMTLLCQQHHQIPQQESPVLRLKEIYVSFPCV